MLVVSSSSEHRFICRRQRGAPSLDTLRVQCSKHLILTKSEIVRFAHGEIICSANCDICRFASSEMKQIPHRRGDFTRRRRISRPQGISQIPKGIYFVKKSTCNASAFFLAPPVGLEPTTLSVRNIVALLAWSASQCSLFLPARSTASSAAGSAVLRAS